MLIKAQCHVSQLPHYLGVSEEVVCDEGETGTHRHRERKQGDARMATSFANGPPFFLLKWIGVVP
ncbi:MAG: hypothetical protein NVS4B1_15020 [Ktedonobacteraceae bacterium]